MARTSLPTAYRHDVLVIRIPLHCIDCCPTITVYCIAMPPFRNPFNKKPPVANGLAHVQDENVRPSLAPDNASQKSSYAGSRTSSSMSIKPRKEETNEFKLSGTCPVVMEDNTCSVHA